MDQKPMGRKTKAWITLGVALLGLGVVYFPQLEPVQQLCVDVGYCEASPNVSSTIPL